MKINLLEEFELVEAQRTALFRFFKVQSQSIYYLVIARRALLWAYLVQREKRPTYLYMLKVGKDLLVNFAYSDRRSVIEFLKVFWDRENFFRGFLRKYGNDILGQG